MPDDFTTPPQQTPERQLPPVPEASDVPPPRAPSAAAPTGNFAPPGHGYIPAPVVSPDQYASPSGPVGNVRSTGICILLCIVTLGIYGLVWYLMVHDEMRRHSGEGLGGVLALVLAIFVGIVMPFVTSYEVGRLYERVGRPAPVTVLTGLWYFPGALILVGPIVWFVKTNAALNDYWRGLGAH